MISILAALLSFSSVLPSASQPDQLIVTAMRTTAAANFAQTKRRSTSSNADSQSSNKTAEKASPSSSVVWQPHEVATLDRPKFSLKYPAAWTIAYSDPDYDPDHLFVINTNSNSYIRIEIPPEPRETRELLEIILEVMENYAINTHSRSKLTGWGNINGEGMHLKGKVMKIFPGGIRVFVGQDKGNTLAVVELYYTEELDAVLPGFVLIQESFAFKH